MQSNKNSGASRVLKNQLIWLGLLIASVFLFATCYEFTTINQPIEASANSSFEVDIVIKQDGVSDFNYHLRNYGCFGVLLPEGWTVEDSIYYSVKGTFAESPFTPFEHTGWVIHDPVYDQMYEDSVGSEEGYYWWGGLSSDMANVDNLDSISLTITINTDNKYGEFYLQYAFGDLDWEERYPAEIISEKLPINIPRGTIVTEDISCFGFNDGSIDLTPEFGEAPYSYLWSTGDTIEDLDSLLPGMYIVEMTDANDSVVTDTAWIFEPDTLIAGIYDSSAISHFGFSDGSAKAKVTGGTQPWHFLWDDIYATEDSVVSTLGGSTYHHLIVTDDNGCTASDSVYIEGSNILFVEIIPDKDSICFNETSGSVRAFAHFADYPVTYAWDDKGGTTDSSLTGISAGVPYHVEITDASGRVGRDSIILYQTDPITLDSLFIEDVRDCYGSKSGLIMVFANMFDPPSVQYSIDSGQTYRAWGFFDTLGAGFYQVLIHDINQCILPVDSIFIDQPPEIKAVIDIINEIPCNGSCEGSVTVHEEGGVQPYSYLWNTGQTSKEIDGVCSGDIVVQVTDHYGCTGYASISLSDPPPITIESHYPEKLCSGTFGRLNLEIAGGKSPYQIWIDPGDTLISTEMDLLPGDYAIRVRDSNNCFMTDTVRINKIMPYPNTEICVVTVDTVTERNLIVWDKVHGQSIDSYNIYRETYAAGVFDFVASVPFNHANTYLDTTIDPKVQAASYKISVVDSCGNESALSPLHHSYHLVVSSTQQGGTNLIWDSYIAEGEDDYFTVQEVYKTHCHPPYPLDMSLLKGVSNTATSFSDNDPENSGRLYQYRIAGVLANSCPVSDSTGALITYSRSYSNANIDPVTHGCDDKPPSAPKNLSVYAIGSFLVMQWDRSYDSWGIEKYNIYDEMGEIMGSTVDTFIIFTDYPIDLSNTFWVTAVDWNYNESDTSEHVMYTPVGYSDNDQAALKIYPNPASDIFIIEFPNSTNDRYRFVLRDLTGKVVKHRESMYDNRFEFRRDDLPAGVYLIEIQGPNIYRGRIVID